MRSIERNSFEHWKIWRSTVSLQDKDDRNDIHRKNRKRNKIRLSTRPRRTFAPRFPKTGKDSVGTLSEPLSTFKPYNHSSKFRNAMNIPILTSSRHTKSSTSNTVVGPGTYNPSKHRGFKDVSYSFPLEQRFSSHELNKTSSPDASHYSIDITRPQAPKYRFGLESRSPRKHNEPVTQTMTGTYVVFERLSITQQTHSYENKNAPYSRFITRIIYTQIFIVSW